MNAWIVRRSPRKLCSWWKTKKEEPNKTRSYPGGQWQKRKKEGDDSYKGRERRKGRHTENTTSKRLRVENCNKRRTEWIRVFFLNNLAWEWDQFWILIQTSHCELL